MKDPIYVSDVRSLIWMPIICSVGGIICLSLQEFFGAVFCFVLAVLFAVPLILWRKHLFKKILIDEEGFKVFYNSRIINKIRWDEIIEIKMVQKFHLYFCISSKDSLLVHNKLIKNNSVINIHVTDNIFQTLLYHKDKISVKVQNFDQLPLSWQKAISE